MVARVGQTNALRDTNTGDHKGRPYEVARDYALPRHALRRQPALNDLARQIASLGAIGNCALLSCGGCHAAVGRVRDHVADISAEERQHVEGALASRRAEYSTGRFLAKRALGRLGIEGVSIVAGGRRPIWPEEVVGSITHSRDYGIAVVAERSQFAGLGIDLELESRVSEKIAPRTMTERERERSGVAWPPFVPTANFSAKEAVFKAINPIVGLMIGFKEVEVAWREEQGAFRASYIGPNPQNAIMERGQGATFSLGDHIGALFWLRPEAIAP